MNARKSPSRSAAPQRTPEQLVQERFTAARAEVERNVKDVVSYAQENPEKALLLAAAGGYLLRMLPVAGILRAVLGLAFTLLKPAALIFGAAKLWQKAQPFVAPPKG